MGTSRSPSADADSPKMKATESNPLQTATPQSAKSPVSPSKNAAKSNAESQSNTTETPKKRLSQGSEAGSVDSDKKRTYGDGNDYWNERFKMENSHPPQGKLLQGNNKRGSRRGSEDSTASDQKGSDRNSASPARSGNTSFSPSERKKSGENDPNSSPKTSANSTQQNGSSTAAQSASTSDTNPNGENSGKNAEPAADKAENNDEDVRPDGSSGGFEWYCGFKELQPYFIKHGIKASARILMAGSGTSALSSHMYEAGYHNIVNCDISPVVVDKMREKYIEKCPKMKWVVADLCSREKGLLEQIQEGLEAQSQQDEVDGDSSSSPIRSTFDLVIDKGTLDAINCGDTGSENVQIFLDEIRRVCCDKFLLISHSKFRDLMVLNDGEADQHEVEDRELAAKEAAAKKDSDSEEEGGDKANASSKHKTNNKNDGESGKTADVAENKTSESGSDARNDADKNKVDKNNANNKDNADKDKVDNPNSDADYADSWRVAEASKCNISDEASMINLIRSLPKSMQKFFSRQIPQEEGGEGEDARENADGNADGSGAADTTAGSDEKPSSDDKTSGNPPNASPTKDDDDDHNQVAKQLVLAAVGKQFQQEKKQRFLRQKILEFQVYQKRHFVFGKEGSFWGSGGREIREKEGNKYGDVKEGGSAEAKTGDGDGDAGPKTGGAADTNAKTMNTEGVDQRGENKHPRQQFVWFYVFRKRGAAGAARS